MIEGRKVLAIIPARGGSKRFPRKNLADYKGKSLIAWAIESGQKSIFIDKLVLSTEDAEIKAKALALGCEVVDRPKALAADDAANEDVMRHAMTIHPDYDWVVLLQPTSPQRTGRDIDECLKRAQVSGTCVSYRADGTKNGAVYVAHASWLERGNNFNRPSEGFYVMPNERSLDVDWPRDLPQNGPRLAWDG